MITFNIVTVNFRRLNAINLLSELTVSLLYTHLQYHNDSIIVKTDAHRKTHEERKQEGRKTQEDFFRKIFISHFIARVRKGCWSFLHVKGCCRPNINFTFWPHCYDRHVVSLLFSWCWGLLHRGFPRVPSVGCGLPYHISSLTLWESAGKCIGGFRGPPRSGVAFPTTSRL